MKGKARQTAGGSGAREQRLAIGALLGGALIWGVIWYPYRLLRDAGVDGIASSTLTYGVAFVLGRLVFRRSLLAWAPSWTLLWLALAAAACNLGYVLATLSGEVVRVLLLFYLAPLWTVLLSRLLLGERLGRAGAGVVALSLLGAATMLWEPQAGLPAAPDHADWLGLIAGFSFALFNVLSRRAGHLSIESKAMAAFAGVAITGTLLLLVGVGSLRLPAGRQPAPAGSAVALAARRRPRLRAGGRQRHRSVWPGARCRQPRGGHHADRNRLCRRRRLAARRRGAGAARLGGWGADRRRQPVLGAHGRAPGRVPLRSRRLTMARRWRQRYAPQHFLNFLPLPQGQGSLRPTFGVSRRMVLMLRWATQKR
ncbi:MAG: carboxylate/amino acid/amine transporter [Candidatus Accumulibacter regalis]|uniref:Carboxylate/amino acid/amine transporter n=1 Tax=Accumulibacter regalis TaxID=522306 RepID=A0A011Q7A1_ACCRE|nr:MAG: carboxylate/amino acid/amine transporter [Candidatus Accumulibacter regalis]